jgi:DNA replication protein DnaC
MARADCPTCGGSGWKLVERTTAGAQAVPTEQSSLPSTAGGGSGEPKMVWAVPCDCTAGDRSERVFVRARVPERYRHCDFENYDTDLYEHGSAKAWNDSIKQAKMIVQRFSDEYMPPTPETGFEQGLLLMGPCGVGKTHLAVAALKQIVSRGHSGVFYDYRELLKQIQDSYNAESQSTEMVVLEPVLKTEVLVLDDVGSSKPSAWALETVGHILNTRYNERRVTLLTSNFLDADSSANAAAQRSAYQSAHPSGHQSGLGRAPLTEDTLSERVGTRIRSRLYEMCRTVEIFAPDYRKEIRNISRRA